MLFFLFHFSITPVAVRTCSSGWKSFEGHCYSLQTKGMSWDSAKEQCKARNANLVSVLSEDESNFIIDSIDLVIRNTTKCIWTGGKKMYDSNTWVWDDGSVYDYTNWNPGEPSNWGPENPQCICYWRGGYRWNDRPCTSWYEFICKKWRHVLKMFSIFEKKEFNCWASIKDE